MNGRKGSSMIVTGQYGLKGGINRVRNIGIFETKP